MSEKPMPQDYIRLSMEKRVKVKVQEGQELEGVLHAYDEHYNIILGDVLESIMGLDKNGKFIPVRQNQIDMLFVRGDRIVSIATI
ncbi:Sm protein [Trichomonas vaginalis G3]|uniref:Sm protein n=1 Tax=Trichomonas vaginalis (strain ATCC PRA-98 / G3) TaxID=412133 RepID=A2E014_TRIV3|nr:cytoplasmic mRNA processing body assembly [Trichomonas vaginalis G3]EAY14073.1 Sm protein [Trichomonas vaginalis G3]KAI5519486.1 cytoplasmic mRNA processing body assembly [Trichomonas vaginalis G3]|eukprot:XP_001326296.1 Sm protein [Trichomonas vaginalis G3]